MGKSRMTPEIEADILRRYHAGNKVVVIGMEHSLSPGSLYHILHKHKVNLRRPAPEQAPAAQPAAETAPEAEAPADDFEAVLEAATKVKQEIPKELMAPVSRLLEQAQVELQGFLTKYREAQREMNTEDAYCESWSEFTLGISSVITRLIERCDDSGITLGLVALRCIMESIDSLNPERKE